MKTKKFFMTSLLVMGMIIAKAANGYPPELVLVSQPVLTYDYNSVTIYYDLQNIGDYTYRGDLCIYLDPDNGYCYASKYMRISAGCIKRVEVSIPAYRPNPSVAYTVMPYYELNDELYSFTTFEYFEPVRFCWYGYRNEPWVVITVGPRPRYYNRPGDYRFYYDGYHPIPHHHHGKPLPPPDPMHHTYGYHHTCGGYPANFHPDHHVPGYNPPGDMPHNNPGNPGGPGHSSDGPGHNNGNPGNNGSSSGASVVHPNGSNTAGSMSSSGAGNNNGSSTSGATTRPNTNSNSNSGATTRPSSSNSGNSGTTVRPNTNSNSSGSTTRPSSSSSGTVSRPSSNNSGSSSRPSSSSSGTVSRPRSNSSSSGSGRSGTSSSGSRTSSSSSSNGRSSSSSSSSSSRSSSSTGGRR